LRNPAVTGQRRRAQCSTGDGVGAAEIDLNTNDLLEIEQVMALQTA
jgi:hypothetical protein